MASLVRSVARQWRIWLSLGVSAFFLIWALKQVSDFGAVGSALGRANYLYVLPALGAYFFGVWLRALRWHYLLRPLRRVSAGRLFPVVVIGYMANDVLPARLGELVRAYVLGERESLSKTATIATIAVERTFDGIAMLTFMALVAAVVPLDERLQQIFRIAGLFFVVALVAFFAIAASRSRSLALLERALRHLPARLAAPTAKIADRFLVGLEVMQSARLVAAVLALSLGAWLAEASMYALVGLGFGLTVGPWAYLLTTAVANLGGMVPSSPGYVGTFEWFALAALGIFGMSANGALSYILVLHAALLVPVTLLGFFYMWRFGLSVWALRTSDLRGEAENRTT